ncbi:MAG: hypothetical protein R3263_00585 [Myxococcota bacterium]|nr:hypothetical protein [Myxococcota bacterium]
MLRTILRVLAIGVVVLAVGVAATLFLARFHDGPLGPIPGGPFEGEAEPQAPRDWGFVDRVPTVELQVGREEPRSVTTWVVQHAGEVYVPSGLAARKTWPHVAEREPMVLLRVDGRIFARRAVRVRDPDLRARLSAILQRKYELGEGAPGAGEDTWWFRLDPPGAGGSAP